MQKKWSLFNRLWHWSNMLLIFALIITSWFLETEIGPQIKKYHIYLGYSFAFLLILRLLYVAFGKDKKNIRHCKEIVRNGIYILREKGYQMNAREKYDFKKAGAKLSYLGLLVCFIGIIATGLMMVFGSGMGLEYPTLHAFKEIHEFFNLLIIIFIVLHLFGVVSGECTYEPNIVSDMINGGKEEA